MKVTFETTDKLDARCYLLGRDAIVDINSLYQQVFRRYLKYGLKSGDKELTDEEAAVVEEVWSEISGYFKEYYIEELQ